jgi:anthranilate synthase/aminodeoxychorismate synthase-like glutamine amidotransferase
MILLLDNYDSFVFNLDRYLQQLGQSTVVVRSDSISVDSIERSNFQAIVISPGPKAPDQAGCSLEAIRRLHNRVPILGVCLGHQCLVQAMGGRIVQSAQPRHGVSSIINHDQSTLFEGLPNPMTVGRYHSLIAEPSSMPECLSVTATCEPGVIMAVEHRLYPVFGVQFHPESILTQDGHRLIRNFLRSAQLDVSENSVQADLCWNLQ